MKNRVHQVRKEASRLAELGWPLILSQLGMMAMGIVDVMMVGHLGDVPLASLALGHGISSAILMPLFGCIIGLDAFFSQAYGADNEEEAGHWLRHGALLLCIVGAFVMALHFLTAPILTVLGQPTELIPLAKSYAENLAFSVPALVMFGLMRRLLQGSGRVKEAMYAVVFGNIVNIIVNYLLIYGTFGAPELGAMGSAWATSFSRYVMMAVLCTYGFAQFKRVLAASASSKMSLDSMKRLCSICGPVAAQLAIEVWAFTASSMMIGWIGVTAIAAHIITLNLASLSFMVPLGLSAAASTRVGNLIGAREPWGMAAITAILMGSSIMLFSAAIFLIMPEFLAKLYTSEPEVILLVSALLPIAGAFQIADGVQAVASGILRGAGDTLVPSIAYITAFWMFGLPVGYIFTFTLGFGAMGVWIGLSLGISAVALILLVRLLVVHRRGARQILTVQGPATTP
jgi:MATE family multidrug resistance protein